MMLVALRRKHGGALRADFQRFYGLNLDDMGRTYGVLHAADLAVHLPAESAVKREMSGGWSRSEHLLAELVDGFALYMWAKAGGKAGRKPKPIPRPGVSDGSNARMKDALLLPVDEVRRRLAMPRRVTAQD